MWKRPTQYGAVSADTDDMTLVRTDLDSSDRRAVTQTDVCHGALLVQPNLQTNTHTHTHTHTHTRLTALCPLSFVRDYPGEPVPERKNNLDFTEARDKPANQRTK